MSVDLTALDSELTKLEGSHFVAPATKEFGAEVVKVLHALNDSAPAPPTPPDPPPVQPPTPPPAIAVTGKVGLYQLGTIGDQTSLATCSHLTDGTYGLVIGNFADSDLLATLENGFPYLATPGTGAYQGPLILDLANPAAFVSAVQTDHSLHGYAGVFIDNVWETLPGMLSFLQGIQPLRARGIKLAGNLDSRNFQGDAGNNGDNWKAWATQCSPLLDYIMCEYFQQVPDNGTPEAMQLRLRGTEWFEWWDGWQTIFGAIHGGGAKAICVTYGSLSNSFYGRASMLTAPGVEEGDVFVANLGTGAAPAGDPNSPAWTTATPHPLIDPSIGTASL